jgi:hypothetical protein
MELPININGSGEYTNEGTVNGWYKKAMPIIDLWRLRILVL